MLEVLRVVKVPCRPTLEVSEPVRLACSSAARRARPGARNSWAQRVSSNSKDHLCFSVRTREEQSTTLHLLYHEAEGLTIAIDRPTKQTC